MSERLQVDPVSYAATLAQRNRYRDKVERLEAELARVVAETNTLREAREAIVKEIIGAAYELLTQGESKHARRQPSARRIYDLAYQLLGKPNPLAASSAATPQTQ